MIQNSWNVGKMHKQCVPALPSPLAEGMGTRLPGLYDVWLCIMFFQRLTNRMTIHFIIIIHVCKEFKFKLAGVKSVYSDVPILPTTAVAGERERCILDRLAYFSSTCTVEPPIRDPLR